MFSEYQRQQNRLFQLVRVYDHQKTARGSELRREVELVEKRTRRQIYFRSQKNLRERSRLSHILDVENQEVLLRNPSESFSPRRTESQERKRRAYGCLLSEFKTPMKKLIFDLTTKTNEDPSKIKADRFTEFREENFQKSREEIRREKIEQILEDSLKKFRYDQSVGYDHFLHTNEANRTTAFFARQFINDKQTQ